MHHTYAFLIYLLILDLSAYRNHCLGIRIQPAERNKISLFSPVVYFSAKFQVKMPNMQNIFSREKYIRIFLDILKKRLAFFRIVC